MRSTPSIWLNSTILAASLGATLWAPKAPLMAQTPPSTTSAASGGEAVDLSGRWAQLVVTTSISKIAVIGDVSSTTLSYGLLDLTQDERGRLTSVEQICEIKITSESKRIRTIIPARFAQAVSGTRRMGTLTIEGEQVKIVMPRKATLFGAELGPSDPLPKDKADKRVRDADGDGKPGLTVQVRGMIDGDLYIVTRGWNELTGQARGKDRVEGRVTWFNEQRVLDATSMFLRGDTNTVPDKTPTKNYFRWQRVPAQTSCAELSKRASEWLR